MNPNDIPAFPVAMSHQTAGNQDCSPYQHGMTLRDYFAVHVMSPMLLQAYGKTPIILAQKAYEIADAMLVCRISPNEKGPQ